MNDLHNIEKSAIRPREYVGYGGGRAWRIRKHGCGGWETIAPDYMRAQTLAELSKKLEALPQPAIDRTR
jgi:hypothetical protein